MSKPSVRRRSVVNSMARSNVSVAVRFRQYGDPSSPSIPTFDEIRVIPFAQATAVVSVP